MKRTLLIPALLLLAAAATANAQVLLDRGALCLADEPVEVVPQLPDRIGAADHATGSRSMSLASAYSQSRRSNSFQSD